MSEDKFILVGRPLGIEELQRFPEHAKFSLAQTRNWRSQTLDELPGDAWEHANTLLLRKRAKLQCPVGPHDDPGLEVVVSRACGISKTGGVAVQCTQGHWAEYPCK
jgi:hypothetical protein